MANRVAVRDWYKEVNSSKARCLTIAFNAIANKYVEAGSREEEMKYREILDALQEEARRNGMLISKQYKASKKCKCYDLAWYVQCSGRTDMLAK